VVGWHVAGIPILDHIPLFTPDRMRSQFAGSAFDSPAGFAMTASFDPE
jgi:hypothetical protein